MPRNSAQYPQRLMPATARRASWREAARRDRETLALKTPKARAAAQRAYEQKWTSVWRTVLDLARDQDGWDEGQLWLIDDFVEARRLAHEYQLAADREGRFGTNDSGRTFAHPGIDKAREQRKESRDIAVELGITPKAMRDAGIEDEPDDEPQGDQAGL